MRQEYINDCPWYLRDFLTYIKVVRNHTDRTVENYYIDLRCFLRYLKILNGVVPKNSPFEQISIADVPISYLQEFSLMGAYEYMEYLMEVLHNGNSTRSRKTSSMRQFYDYLYSKAMLINRNPVELLEHPKPAEKLPKFMGLDQSIKLLDSIESKNQKRDYAIITLFLNCGMRLSELVGLNINDYSESSRTLRLFGKGQKERIVYINDACIEAINEYLKVRPKSEIEPNAMFISSHANNLTRLTPRRVQRIVEDQLKRAGLGNLGLSTHKLRHTAATIMYEYGHVDPMVLKDVLGHKSVATTQIYTHLSDSDRRKAVENSPLKNIKNTAVSPADDSKSKKDDE